MDAASTVAKLLSNRERLADLPCPQPSPPAGWAGMRFLGVNDLFETSAACIGSSPSDRHVRAAFPASLADDFKEAANASTPRFELPETTARPVARPRAPAADINDYSFPKEGLQQAWVRAARAGWKRQTSEQ